LNQFIVNGDKGAPAFVFAHGAGAAMDSEFMNTVAEGFAEKGIRVIRFEFPYMQVQRVTNKRRPPDRQPKLLEHFQSVLDELDVINPVIGGKSMGGRMATLLAAEHEFPGVVVLGYPFHALGKPEKVRVDHFCQLKAPVLICQGERDSMGTQSEVAQYRLPKNIDIEWFADGDHDLKPRKSSGLLHESHLNFAIDKVSQFIHEIAAP
jgi:predicted alpha/beta-hydrolase family hydrolase